MYSISLITLPLASGSHLVIIRYSGAIQIRIIGRQHIHILVQFGAELNGSVLHLSRCDLASNQLLNSASSRCDMVQSQPLSSASFQVQYDVESAAQLCILSPLTLDEYCN